LPQHCKKMGQIVIGLPHFSRRFALTKHLKYVKLSEICMLKKINIPEKAILMTHHKSDLSSAKKAFNSTIKTFKNNPALVGLPNKDGHGFIKGVGEKMKETKAVAPLNTNNPIREFLANTLNEIMCLVGAECGSLFLFDLERNELVLDSFQNSTHIPVCGLRRKVGEGVSGKVVELKTPVLVRNIDQDLRFKRNGFKHYHTNSFISIPLIANNSIIGLINIADKASGEPFIERDFEFAVTIAKYSCKAMEHLLKPKGKNDTILEKYATVGKLAAGVVHEVNNPLDGVIRYANILLAQMDNNPAAREYILEMKKGLSRIANTTKTLLQFSHQVNSNHPKQYLDLYEIIDESLILLRDKINGSIQINKKYQKPLPRILDLGISHVVINLIKNALDAMPEVGRLDITTGIKDSMLEIRFKDSGYGIPDEIMDHIFEPFFTTKSKDKGTGLGLAICKEIIDRYEGKIEVQSFADKGSDFTVSIPVKYLENV